MSAPDAQQNEPNVNLAITRLAMANGQEWVAFEFLVANTRYTFAVPPETARTIAAQLPEEIENVARECTLNNSGIIRP